MPGRALSSSGRIRRLLFESLDLTGGTACTRWTPIGRRVSAQVGFTRWGLDPAHAAGRPTPTTSNPRALIAFIHTVHIWRSPSQTFATVSELLTDPAPPALRLAGIRALPMIPGVRMRPGTDWLGRHGRVYALGDQSIVINPATGGVLGFRNATLTEAFTQSHLAPRCVAHGSFLRPASGPRWCFVMPKVPAPREAAARLLAQRDSIARK